MEAAFRPRLIVTMVFKHVQRSTCKVIVVAHANFFPPYCLSQMIFTPPSEPLTNITVLVNNPLISLKDNVKC